MGIISYAQNFEDVMLWRALKDIENGFYIDIGANHPDIDSVTKAFYDNEWTGINIEPELELFQMLIKSRPNDINLNIAISSSVDSIDFFVSSTRGWSTTSKDQVDNLEGKDALKEVRIVKALSLDNLIDKYNIKDIHFLKIDVEGAEKDVLESYTFKNARPWIMCIEATKPTTQIDISSEWEHLLLENGYIFAYFDGLNKFYVAKEHPELLSAFKSPPNVFDGFTLIHTVEANNKTHKWRLKAGQAEEKVSVAEAKASVAEAKASEAIHNHYLIMNSNSWKITKPLRLASEASQWFFSGIKSWITFAPGSRPRLVMKNTLIIIKHKVNSNPKLKTLVLKILNRFPKLKARLKSMNTPIYEATSHFEGLIDSPEQLSPRAKKIYNDLQAAIQKQKGAK